MTDVTISDELRRKIAAIESQQTALLAERDTDVSFAAIVNRDKKAIARLAEINDELGRIGNETAALQSALKEAGRRVTAAAAADAAEAERARAEQALPIAERLAERGKKLDEAMREYVANFAGIKDDIEELALLGVPIPSRDLVRVNMRIAHDTSTSPLDKTSRPVAPTMRRNFAALTAGWAVPSLRWITEKLNTKSAHKAAA